MLVQGDDISIYDLKVEHVYKDHVFWKGQRGKMVFLQEELPYHQLSFGDNGNVGYRVADNVIYHTAYALGVYIVGVCGNIRNVTAVVAPNTASLHNIVGWDNGADVSAFSAILCHGGTCSRGNCQGDKCRLHSTPQAAPTPRDTFLLESQLSDESKLSDKCIAVGDGINVVMATCNDYDVRQYWQYNGGRIIHNTQDGRQLCIDVPADPHQRPGDKLQVYTCVGSSSQQWSYDHLVGSVNFGPAGATTFCMDLTGGSEKEGTLVQLWNCDSSGGYLNQRWNARTIFPGAVLVV